MGSASASLARASLASCDVLRAFVFHTLVLCFNAKIRIRNQYDASSFVVHTLVLCFNVEIRIRDMLQALLSPHRRPAAGAHRLAWPPALRCPPAKRYIAHETCDVHMYVCIYIYIYFIHLYREIDR